VQPEWKTVPDTHDVPTCQDGYKLAEPVANYYLSGVSGGFITSTGANYEPPADVKYDGKKYNYVKPIERPDNVCIKESSPKTGAHE
jgi:hypothetical protein